MTHFFLIKQLTILIFIKRTVMKITFTNLRKEFGDKVAVNIENLDVKPGTLLGIVGNNGAGKTTLFRLTLDLLRPDCGEVITQFVNSDGTTFGTDVKVSEEWKVYTGAYIDENFLIDFLTPEEYFEFIAKANDMSKSAMTERIEKFSHFMNEEIVGKNKIIRSMSAGNKQKIGIISAMLNDPQLLILDEPFNSLDPSSQNILKKILVEYNKATGATILISSHNLSHTMDICNRIVIMEHGCIVKDFSEPNSSTRQELEEYFNK